MKLFSLDEFLKLTQKTGNPFISIYTPTHRQSTNGYQADKTHFKNQLAKAEKGLAEEYDMDEDEIKKITQPARIILDDYDFWKYNSDMLACFLNDGEMEIFQLPVHIEDSTCFIGTKPFLLPMIPELNDDGHYFLLLLNLDQIRLYEVTRSIIQEVTIDPEAVAVSFTGEMEEMENQSHLHAQGRVGNAGAMYHGHGDGSDEEKKSDILNYFHRMTNMLEPILYKNPLPLYLAGVEYLGPIFRQASKYNHLQEGMVTGAYSEKDMQELHQKSWELAEPYFRQERLARKEVFGAKKAKNLAISNDNHKLILAALTGGVDTLLVNEKHEHLWGKYDPETHKIHLSDSRQNGNHCLIDEAATKVKEFKGKVYLVAPEDMPEDTQIAGTLRYAL
ncbi:baeRF7 domain-containing protein [Pararhodonellum marinum]|uniref:baeRF7 domain-containing protein n=1 Tax=Pararhodonellum marinum TaxID=2755358 RepID=UPI00188F96B7|nr:hypothetical protein [Pararhodonellum marinum]